MKKSIPKNGAKKRTSFQGKALNHPNNPLYPFLRPVISNVANSENAVINVGTTTIIVKITWINFQVEGIPGSVNWWRNPTGTEKNSNKTKDNLANATLKIFPPIIFGIITYQAM